MNKAASQPMPQPISQATLYQQVSKLSSVQRAALVQHLQMLGLPIQTKQLQTKQVQPEYKQTGDTPAQSTAHTKLVAYAVPKKQTLDISALHAALKEKLPPYMVPSAIVSLDSLPRTANGKIDVKALPAPQATLASTTSSDKAAPRTPTETKLCQIWQEVLGVKRIGIYDNFFELGGDSILSIQIVSKAREAGLRLLPNQLFEQPTIAELAAAVNTVPEVKAIQGAVTGPIPLTPIQHWFFDLEMIAPEHWHQGLLLALPKRVTLEDASKAIAYLWNHHDALRLRFHKTEAGWQQINAGVEAPPTLKSVDCSTLNDAEQRQAVESHGRYLHASLQLAQGPALQAVWFNRGKNKTSWLLISLHHLVVDAVSWQILQHDLRCLLKGQCLEPQSSLPAKTTSFQTWAHTLMAQAQLRQSELAFWRSHLSHPHARLPQDTPSQLLANERLDSEGEAHTVSVLLDTVNTTDLLTSVPSVYNTQINDVLLTALTRTLLDWTRAESIQIELETHGREQIVPDVDLSRTVGWFTATHPVRLKLSERCDPGIALKSIKEQIRQIPHRGIGYGILRYLGSETIKQQLAQYPSSEVLFNYLGQLDNVQRETIQQDSAQQDSAQQDSVQQDSAQQDSSERIDTISGDDLRVIQDLDLGAMRDPRNRRGYLLEINAWVSEHQLRMNWTYDTQRYKKETIGAIARAYLHNLTAIITHCTAVEQVGFTLSDFPDIDVTQEELDALIDQISIANNNLETIYPLAPLQESFLWNSLQSTSSAGLLHMRGTLQGELNADLMRQAWEQVFAQHPVLRTSVHWERIKSPVQVVAKQVSLPWQQLDWRGMENANEAIAQFLERDRTLGFNFTQPPITRLTLIQLSDQTHEMIWSCHHLMFDGWSGALVFNQVLSAYESLKANESLKAKALPHPSPARTYQAYVRWLAVQDEKAAEAFWSQALKGVTQPTPLHFLTPTQQTPSPDIRAEKAVQNTDSVQQFIRRHRLTLNTLIQGIWGLLLSAHSNDGDVLFGATVSGRQGDLAGVEHIVGLLINVLPVRVELDNHKPVLEWLRSLQSQQTKASQYAYASPSQIQTWSDCSSRLFNSLLVVENYPANRAGTDQTIALENLRSGIISNYDLTLIVKPGNVKLGNPLTLYAQASEDNRDRLQKLLTEFERLLSLITNNASVTVQQLLDSIQLLSTVPRRPQASDSSFQPLALASAPATPLELKLAKIWSSALQIPSLGVTDSFFDAGGNSLLAVQLFNRMQQQLGCTLPLATLFQAPTVRQFATLLGEEQAGSPSGNQSGNQSGSQAVSQAGSQWSSLVPIRTEGDRIPFFFHGGSADALTWARFSHLLGSDQPFYALQRPDLDGRDIAHLTVEALAATCIQEIKTVQPNGPYLIGGHCFGGAVAFEIASQLQSQGETIAALIQIDAYCPNALPNSRLGHFQEQLQLTTFQLWKSYYYHAKPEKLIQLPKKIWNKIRPAKPTSQKRSSPETPSLSVSTTAAIPASAAPPTASSAASTITSLRYEDRYAQAHQANLIAADHYRPQQHAHRYTGPVTLFSANVQILDWRYGKRMGWESVTHAPIKIIQVPGLFGNLFNQRSGPLLAQKVKAYLHTRQDISS